MQNGRMRRIAALLKWKKIGRVSNGFDFLGFHCCPTGMTVSEASLLRQDEKIARLYEQGASKERVGVYLRRWLGWARVLLLLTYTVGLVTCAHYPRACIDTKIVEMDTGQKEVVYVNCLRTLGVYKSYAKVGVDRNCMKKCVNGVYMMDNRELAESLNNKAYPFIKRGELDKGIELLNKAIAIDGNYAESYINRGIAYSKKGQYDRAIEDYDSAIKIIPNSRHAYYYRGKAYEMMGQYDEAISDFQKACDGLITTKGLGFKCDYIEK